MNLAQANINHVWNHDAVTNSMLTNKHRHIHSMSEVQNESLSKIGDIWQRFVAPAERL